MRRFTTGIRTARAGFAAIVAAGMLLCISAAGAQEWSWQLPVKEYQQLDVFQRSAYGKAAALLTAKDYRAAAHMFEKFRNDFPDSPATAHILFLRAYSLHLVKDRNAAIKAYNEILDYFPGEINPASAALYHMAMAHHENGEPDQALELMQEMSADEDYRAHPLAATALVYLADHASSKGRHEQAVAYWKQIIDDFSDKNRHAVANAQHRAASYYINNRQAASYENYRAGDNQDPAFRKGLMDHIWHVARHTLNHRPNDPAGRKWHKETVSAFYGYFRTRQGIYQKAGDPWGYYTRGLEFLTQCRATRDEITSFVDEASKYIATIGDKGRADGMWAFMTDRLREARHYERARYCLTRMTDRPYAAYKEHEILAHEGKWAPSAQQLETVEAMGNAYWTRMAWRSRADIYRHHLRRHAEAIQLYQKVDDPPATLWAIQDCYIRWGKLSEALTTLTTIENLFPDHAANAAWHKAEYLDRFSRTPQAIAAARRILKVYPRSPQSSHAHQLLEKHKVKTGGGVADEDG